MPNPGPSKDNHKGQTKGFPPLQPFPDYRPRPLPTSIGVARTQNRPEVLLEFPLVKIGRNTRPLHLYVSEWELSSAGRAADS